MTLAHAEVEKNLKIAVEKRKKICTKPVHIF